jgi:uncharacterized protein YjbI with pentapeptide repeats
MDRNCHPISQEQLAKIIFKHKQWLEKYAIILEDQKALKAVKAFQDPLYANLSNFQFPLADLSGKDLEFADLTLANLDRADLGGASLRGADLTQARLSHASLVGAHFESAYLGGVELDSADLTDAHLVGAFMEGAKLARADLSGADLDNADLTGADLTAAQPLRASFNTSSLTDAILKGADLTGADLTETDFTSANLDNADLSWTKMVATDFTYTEVSGVVLWYANFGPKVPPQYSLIAGSEGLETIRWPGTFDEIGYRNQLEGAPQSVENTGIRPPHSLSEHWLLWLSWNRERQAGQVHSWAENRNYLWTELKNSLHSWKEKGVPGSDDQTGYQIIDIRHALTAAGYVQAESQANLAYKRHTQSVLGMIVFDWTCEYGADPWRPLWIALWLAVIAVPVYRRGFLKRWLGSQLLKVETHGEKEVETRLGNTRTRPKWRRAIPDEPRLSRVAPRNFIEWLNEKRAEYWLRFRQFVVSRWPRLLWEARFLKSVLLFSLISMVNLGFEGLDFGRWVRNLTFCDYDLKARGLLRTAAGLQSLVGLGLLALSLLSFFGHPFE